jgi:hypothetical protein
VPTGGDASGEVNGRPAIAGSRQPYRCHLHDTPGFSNEHPCSGRGVAPQDNSTPRQIPGRQALGLRAASAPGACPAVLCVSGPIQSPTTNRHAAGAILSRDPEWGEPEERGCRPHGGLGTDAGPFPRSVHRCRQGKRHQQLRGAWQAFQTDCSGSHSRLSSRSPLGTTARSPVQGP